jgi:hypothetical protein
MVVGSAFEIPRYMEVTVKLKNSWNNARAMVRYYSLLIDSLPVCPTTANLIDLGTTELTCKK